MTSGWAMRGEQSSPARFEGMGERSDGDLSAASSNEPMHIVLDC